MAKPKYYLTTPVYSATSEPQIGPFYSAILGDAITRHKRMCGFDVAHLMSTKSHELSPGDPGESAGAGGVASPNQGYVAFAELLNLVNVHGTRFQYTGSPEHVLAVEELIHRITRRSRLSIYKSAYQGRYCAHDQMDVSDSTDPIACPACGRAAELISGERHFFRLSAFQGQLMALYKYRPGFIQPQDRADEVTSSVTSTLKDVAISCKSNQAGIRWPGDPDFIVDERLAKLATYLSGVRFAQTEDLTEEFRRYWPPNLHLVGPESLWSHAVFWPALLMAADLPLPRHIFVHGAVRSEQGGTGITSLFEQTMRSRSSEAVRYDLLLEVGTHDVTRLNVNDLSEHANVDLEQGLEKLASRIHALLISHSDGKIPTPALFSKIDPTIEIALGGTRAEVRFLLDRFDFSEALRKIWSFMAIIQKLLDDNSGRERSTDPSEKQQFTEVLYEACQGLGWMALLLHPILPDATDAIWSSLGQTTTLEQQLIDEAPWSCVMSGTPIGKLEGLFPREVDPQNAAQPKAAIRATH